MTFTRASLPLDLSRAVERAGYFPETARAAVERSVRGAEVRAFLVRPETTFDGPEVRRHLTVLVMTDRHLFVTHVDDEVADALNPTQVVVSTERVALERVRSVGLSQVFDTDGAHISAAQSEVTIGISWGASRRIDLERAWCDDPQCEADHGMTGTSSPSDLVIRVSALADGRNAVEECMAFYDAISEATQ